MKEVKKERLRLDRFLCSQNQLTRKEAVKLIKSGAVLVDGNTVITPSIHIDTHACSVEMMGVQIQYHKYVYLMMNKPAGVLTASRDSHAKTVMDILPDAYMRRGLFPAGRLDKDTTGLLIITNDGEYAHKMLQPKKKVYKLYKAYLSYDIKHECVKLFNNGIHYQNVSYAPARLEIINDRCAYIEICEGKYHQVKLMFEACGNRVKALERLGIGALMLDTKLKHGETRHMTKEEAQMVLLPRRN